FAPGGPADPGWPAGQGAPRAIRGGSPRAARPLPFGWRVCLARSAARARFRQTRRVTPPATAKRGWLASTPWGRAAALGVAARSRRETAAAPAQASFCARAVAPSSTSPASRAPWRLPSARRPARRAPGTPGAPEQRLRADASSRDSVDDYFGTSTWHVPPVHETPAGPLQQSAEVSQPAPIGRHARVLGSTHIPPLQKPEQHSKPCSHAPAVWLA